MWSFGHSDICLCGWIHITMDYAQSRTCYGPEHEQRATSVPIFPSLFNQLFHDDHKTTRETLENSIENALTAIYDFFVAHQIDEHFVMPTNENDLGPILQNFGEAGTNRFCIIMFYLMSLIGSYMRCIFGTPEQQQIYTEGSDNQKANMGARAIIDIWSDENLFVSREDVVRNIYEISWDQRDEWNPNQHVFLIPHNKSSHLRRYLKMVHYRAMQYDMTPPGGEEDETFQYAEFTFERYMYEYYHHFQLFRQPLPHHFNFPHHPPRPNDGDDWPQAIVPDAAPPQLDDDGGD